MISTCRKSLSVRLSRGKVDGEPATTIPIWVLVSPWLICPKNTQFDPSAEYQVLTSSVATSRSMRNVTFVPG